MARRGTGRGRAALNQVILIVIVLGAWQFLPLIPGISNVISFLNPYFISSPTKIVVELANLATGANATTTAWPFLGATLAATLIGTAAGMILGGLVALWLSSSPKVSRLLRPWLVAFNAVPRVALIPIFVIIFGPNEKASAVAALSVVFFVVFFNAFEGARTVAPHIIANAAVLGATQLQIMFRVRLRFVMGWALAALPNAISFGLVTVVTSEILTGTEGMGRLLLDSVNTVDATLTFAVVVALSIVGLILIGLANLVERRWMGWWRAGEGAPSN